MDFWILLIVRKVLRTRGSIWKLLLAACFGSACFCGAVLFPAGILGMRLVLAQFPAGVGMLWLSANPKGRRAWIKGMSSLYGTALLFGGIFTYFVYGGFFTKRVGAGIVSFFGIAAYFLVSISIKIWDKIQEQEKLYLEFELSLENCTLKGICLLDSGNHLKDPISKKPVSIVESQWILPMERQKKEENIKLIPYHSIGKNHGMMRGFVGDKLVIKRERDFAVIKRPVIGISENPLSDKGDYQMILSPALLQE